ncbi:MAG: translation initiation factor IF-2 [Paludibacteraceae bacterium]|nr:translation initiation factor IF-2 [Paludibacteraceae bacterium]MBR5824521.1 translation initiation factor IF-2 [Paludibacteraceae bacterium]
MARLGKLVKTLKIGIGTATEFLKSKGFTVDEDFNSKLTSEQEALLLKEYATPEMLAEFEAQKKEPKKVKVEEPKKVKAEEPKKEVKNPEVKAEPEKPQLNLNVVGKIDLGALNQSKAVEKKEEPKAAPKKEEPKKEAVPVQPAPKKEEKKAEPKPKKEEKQKESKPVEKENLAKENKTEKPAVKAEPKKVDTPQPVETPKVAETKTVEEPKPEKKEDEIFTFRKVEFKSDIKVLDKIDLSSINSNTRPAKKSKEELRKDRIAKERQAAEARRKAQKEANKKHQKEGKSDEVFSVDKPKLQGPNVVDKIDLGGQGKGGEKGDKKKRKRIGGERVDVSKAMQGGQPQGGGQKEGKKKNKNQKAIHTPVVSEEDVARQVKETLARLTEGNKGVKKGAKYRKEKREANAQRLQNEQEMEQLESKILKLTEFVTANELAVMMNVNVTQIIQTCFNLGLFVSINQRLDAETINIVADEFGFQTEFVSADVVNAIQEEEDSEEDLLPRPPIVTVMGHVDHGKTSLLDYIRKSNVIAGEAGGITQHIGAYNVTLEDGRHITFLDTPGHEAFTAMRARGAQVTDIAIIIVAADDNVMPQTVEAINHASAAGVPIVFAINKVDKPSANPDKIKESLAAMNYLVEEWGGKYQSQDISAKHGMGVNELLEKVLLEAELLDLKANPNRKASGSVIESSLDKGRGYVATVLVNNGTLRVGDVMLAGTSYGRVKAMFNERNQRIKEAGPAEPVIVLGLNGAPQAGDNFNIFDQDHEARDIANKREQLAREQGLRTSKHLTLEEIGRRIALGNFQELNLIVKGDVDGSIEALSDSLLKLSTEEIQVNVIHKAVGQISESDVTLAAASNAIIVGFQVRPSMEARKLAEKEEVDIRLYSIIYDAIEELKAAMEGMLAPDIKEEITATLEIRETFKITKVGTIAGCMVKEGKIKRTNKIRLIRDGIVIYTGELASLKRMKDDVKEVNFGYECGLNIANYNDIRIGDIIEAYEEVEVKKTL